jgi:hypothetical protein
LPSFLYLLYLNTKMTTKNLLTICSLAIIFFAIKFYGVKASLFRPVSAAADVCTWEGDVSLNWGDGTSGVNTNWSCSVDGNSFPETGDSIYLKVEQSGWYLNNNLSESNVYDSISVQRGSLAVAGNKLKFSSLKPITVNQDGSLKFVSEVILTSESPEIKINNPASWDMNYNQLKFEGGLIVDNILKELYVNTLSNKFVLWGTVNSFKKIIKIGTGELHINNTSNGLNGDIIVQEGSVWVETNDNKDFSNTNFIVKNKTYLRAKKVKIGMIKAEGGIVELSGECKGVTLSQNATFKTEGHFLKSSGPIDLSIATFAFDNLTNQGQIDSYYLIDNLGTEKIKGTLKNYPEGKVFQLPYFGTMGKISYVGGDGNDLVVSKINYYPIITVDVPGVTGTDDEDVELTAKIKNDGQPIKGEAEIIFYSNGKKIGVAKTDGNGVAKFNAGKLPEGEYKFTASYEGVAVTNKITSNEDIFHVQKKDSLPTLFASPTSSPFSLRVRVFDQNGKPLNGVRVSTSYDVTVFGTTDQNGFFAFENLTERNGQIIVDVDGKQYKKAINLDSDSTDGELDFKINPAALVDQMLTKKTKSNNSYILLGAILTLVLAISAVAAFIGWKRGWFKRMHMNYKVRKLIGKGPAAES